MGGGAGVQSGEKLNSKLQDVSTTFGAVVRGVRGTLFSHLRTIPDGYTRTAVAGSRLPS